MREEHNKANARRIERGKNGSEKKTDEKDWLQMVVWNVAKEEMDEKKWWWVQPTFSTAILCGVVARKWASESNKINFKLHWQQQQSTASKIDIIESKVDAVQWEKPNECEI